VKEKDYIKDLFKDRFNDFEADVDPGLWDKIQTEMAGPSSLPSAKGSASIGKTMIWIAAISITTVSVIAYSVWNDNNIGSITEQKVEQPKEGVKKDENVSNVPLNIVEDKGDENEEPIIEEIINSKIAESKPAKEDVVLNEVVDNKEITESILNDEEVIPNETIVESTKSIVEDHFTDESENVISKAPNSINIQTQSRVVASPMGGNAPLDVSFNSIASVKTIKWKFDDGEESSDMAPNHTYNDPGIYFVTMMAELEDGTVVMDKAVIEVKEAVKELEDLVESSIFVPNIFTPNGDSENDMLSVNVENVTSYTISIYCVNGRLVFSSDNPDEKWDGIDKQGNAVVEGVYYYLINAIGENNNVYAPKGYITVRR
jgi:gliding motility-associated-like protein